MNIKPHILPIIIFSQFACTSLWFAGNAIVGDLAKFHGLEPGLTGLMLSSVQLGFITGTLLFAALMLVDRFSPSKLFLGCAILAALCNAVLLLDHLSELTVLTARFTTGFFLAGIYPVGMKIAADYYEKGLGRALGFLVGALVLGTSFPHAIRGMALGTNYSLVITITSCLAICGGLAMYLLVPHGPFRKPSTILQLKAGVTLFKIPAFKKAAFGYFGHMWELYAFWAFLPFAIGTYNSLEHSNIPISFWSFIIIALGSISCTVGGYVSLTKGSKKVALMSLAISGILCLISPLLFQLPTAFFLILLSLWGMAVVSDSPQFSTMVADSAPPQLKGTALTLVNCIGFTISIVSIQLLSFLTEAIEPVYIFGVLGLGPLFGLISLARKSS
ncbi:MFS transporter [Flavobacteriaceae bacterium KMM 6897]|nr:MFS transporter [Flavobacteriaceae bacterium KMM 6897]MEB8344426.1 MFS transporter [Flavobacteriaceae bacterium KMM 6898]